VAKTTLVNVKKVEGKRPRFNVYIGRQNPWQGFKQSIFANPFKIGEDCSRKQAIVRYRKWLLGTAYKDFRQEQRMKILRAIPKLKGKILGCWCSPLPCHGDVLIELLRNPKLLRLALSR
jgi:hypothetical protein